MVISRTKNIALGLVMAAAVLTMPSGLASAQLDSPTPTPTPPLPTSSTIRSDATVITWQQLQNMADLADALNQLPAGQGEIRETDEWRAAAEACASINGAIRNITNNNVGAGLVGSGKIGCAFGAPKFVQGSGSITSFDTVIIPNPDMTQRFQGLVNSQENLDQTQYEAIKAQLDALENPEEVNALSVFLGSIITTLFNILASILAGIAAIALYLMNLIVDAAIGNLANFEPEIIGKAWTVIRDIMNLMFIIALIVMAVGTILQREQYNRRLLGQLILMAILINFSKVIAETLISMSDSLIALFQPGDGFVDITKQIYSAFISGGDGLSGVVGFNNNGVASSLATGVSKLIGLFVLTVSVCAFAGLMLVRAVGLWFLVMTSPIAYGLNVLPQTAPYAKRWWDYFIKYLIWGPVAMFFFRVGFTYIRDVGLNHVDDSALNPVIIGAFFYAGFLVARGSGMMGASMVTGAADQALGKGKKWLQTGTIGTAAFGGKAAGNYVWRGKAAGHLVGAFAGKERGKEFGEKVGRGTAWLSNRPKSLKEKYIDKPNEERKKVVSKQYRRMQIDKIYNKDLNKELAGSLNSSDIYHLAKSGQLNTDKVKAIVEHGGRDAVDTLMLAYKDGLIEKTQGLEKDQKDEIRNIVAAAKWKSAGGKEYEMTDDFLRNFERMIHVRATRGFNDAERAMINDFDREDARKKWAQETKTDKDRKAVIDNKELRRQVRAARDEAAGDDGGRRRVRAQSRPATPEEREGISNPPGGNPPVGA